MSFQETIQQQHEARLADGLWRERRQLESAQGILVRANGCELINFSSNDYLGLASDSALKSAARNAIETWGVGAAASHLVCGHQTPHEKLETEIADLVGAESAIVFSTGYMANLAVPSAFLSRHDLLLQDKLNHASLIDAGLLCRAESKRFHHCDVKHAAELLKDETRNTMLATDGVFSMNGNVAPLKELKRICDADHQLLVVDDAHGLGAIGKDGAGSLSMVGLPPTNNILMVGTLSKAIGAFGAFVAGDKQWIEHLIQFARPFIYTTALPPSIVEAARRGIEIARSKPELRIRLQENIQTFHNLADQAGIEILPSTTPIQSVVFGSPSEAVSASTMLQQAGFLVVAIRPPTVPAGTSRLRITLSAGHESHQIQSLVDSLKKCMP